MKYKIPSLTADAVVIHKGKILLVERGEDPYKGMLAIPGGFVEYGEKVEDAAMRELNEETGIDGIPRDILGVYSDPKRDPRGHVITVTFIAEPKNTSIIPGDDAKNAKWYELDDVDPSRLAADHAKIFRDLLRWIKSRGTYWSGKN